MSRQNFIVFFILTAIGFFAYKDCLNIFIPGDNYSQLLLFEKGFINGFAENPQSASPYFVGFPLLYFLYKLFGMSSTCWIITSTLLHVTNSFVIFLITRKLMIQFFHKHETAIAFLSALIFLLSPYQTEDVLWITGSIRWLFHTLVTLSGFYLFILYLSAPSFKKLICIHLLFLLGIFSYEFTIICPLIYITLYYLFKITNKTFVSTKQFLIRILSVQFLFVAMYFIVCKIWSGHWFWHGGTVGDITQTTDYIKTFLKYLAKFFLLYRYIPLAHADDLIRTVFGSLYARILLLALISAVSIYLIKRIIKGNKETGYFLLAMFACFMISLLPVLPLDSSFLKYIYPDRYGYHASAFFYIFFVASVFLILKKLALPLLAGYCILCWLLLMQTISVWNDTNDYCNKLVKNYKPFLQYDHVFVLNAPSYYKGVAAFRSAFSETIYMRYNKSPVEKIHAVSGVYQESWTDTLTSVKKYENTIKVIGPKKNTPHFCVGGWAKSYETKDYTVDFDSTGCSYQLTFKQGIPSNSAFIYTSNGTWKKAE